MDIRVGMVGFGAAGRRHALAWRALALTERDLPGTVHLVGIAAPSEEAAPARDVAGFPLVTRDLEEIIGHPEVDILDICAPRADHAPALRSALAAGKNILCEPPIALDLREAEQIAGLAGRRPGAKQMVSAYRWLPAVVRTKALVGEGAIGEPQSFRLFYRRPLVPDDDFPHNLVAGSVLMDMLPHALDVARALNGDIGEVNATVEAFPDEEDPDAGPTREIVSSLLRFTNGSVGVLEASRALAGPFGGLRVEMRGAEGAVELDLATPDAVTLTGAAGGPEVRRVAAPAPLDASLGEIAGEVAGLRMFVRAISEELPAEPGFRDGLLARRTIAAIVASAEEGTWQPVDLGR